MKTLAGSLVALLLFAPLTVSAQAPEDPFVLLANLGIDLEREVSVGPVEADAHVVVGPLSPLIFHTAGNLTQVDANVSVAGVDFGVDTDIGLGPQRLEKTGAASVIVMDGAAYVIDTAEPNPDLTPRLDATFPPESPFAPLDPLLGRPSFSMFVDFIPSFNGSLVEGIPDHVRLVVRENGQVIYSEREYLEENDTVVMFDEVPYSLLATYTLRADEPFDDGRERLSGLDLVTIDPYTVNMPPLPEDPTNMSLNAAASCGVNAPTTFSIGNTNNNARYVNSYTSTNPQAWVDLGYVAWGRKVNYTCGTNPTQSAGAYSVHSGWRTITNIPKSSTGGYNVYYGMMWVGSEKACTQSACWTRDGGVGHSVTLSKAQAFFVKPSGTLTANLQSATVMGKENPIACTSGTSTTLASDIVSILSIATGFATGGMSFALGAIAAAVGISLTHMASSPKCTLTWTTINTEYFGTTGKGVQVTDSSNGKLANAGGFITAAYPNSGNIRYTLKSSFWITHYGRGGMMAAFSPTQNYAEGWDVNPQIYVRP